MANGYGDFCQHCVETSSGANPVSYPANTGYSFPEGEEKRAWSCAFTSILCRTVWAAVSPLTPYTLLCGSEAPRHLSLRCNTIIQLSNNNSDSKANPLPAGTHPEGSRRLGATRISRQLTYEGSKIVSRTQRSPLTPRGYPWCSFLLQLSRPHGHSAAGRIN